MKWDQRFMRIATEVATWSKDPRSKVGAVLVQHRNIVATGYNGFPKGIADDSRLEYGDQKLPIIVHAEMNAILDAGRLSRGATLYMIAPFGGMPCRNCAKHLITAGVARVVALPPNPRPSKWHIEGVQGGNLLREAGVVTEVFDVRDT